MLPSPVISIHVVGQNSTGPAISAVTASLKDLQLATDGANRSMAAHSTTLSAVKRAMEEAAGAANALGGGFKDMGASMAALDFDKTLAGVGKITDAYGLMTKAVREQIVALGDLKLAQDAQVAGGGGIPITGGSRRPAPTHAPTAHDPVVKPHGAMHIAGRAAGLPEGVLGSLGNAAFSPWGMAVVAAGMIGYSASSNAVKFQSAGKAVQAQTGASDADMALLQKASLQYGSSGKSQFNGTDLESQVGYYGFSSGASSKVLAQSLPIFSQTAAIAGQKDMITAANAITDLQDAFGGGGKAATQASLGRYSDMLVQAEMFGKTQAGDIAKTVSRFAPNSQLSGVSAEEALAMVAKQTGTGTTAKQASQNVAALERSLFIKPVGQTEDLAKYLGLTVGAGAVKHYGSAMNALKAYQSAIGDDPDMMARFLHNQGAIQGYGLIGNRMGNQSGFDFTTELADKNRSAQARNVRTTQYGVTQQGVQQQADALQARLNTDMTKLGLTLNQTVIPALLKTATSALDFVDAVTTKIPDIKGWIDSHLPGGVGTALAAGAGPLGLPFIAAKGAFDHFGGPASSLLHAPYGGHSASDKGHYITGAAGRKIWVPASDNGIGSAPAARSAASASFPVAMPSGTDASLNPSNPAMGGGGALIATAIKITAAALASQGSLGSGAEGKGAGSGLPADIDARRKAARDYLDHVAHPTSKYGGLGDLAGSAYTTASSVYSNDQIAHPALGALGVAAQNIYGQAQGMNIAGAGPNTLRGGGGGAAAQSQMLIAAQQQVTAAQLFSQSVAIHHGSVEEQKKAIDRQYASDLHLATAQGLKGADLANAKFAAKNTRDSGLAGVAGNKLSTDQSHLALLQANGDTAGAKALIDQILQDEAATGVNSYQLQLDKQNLTGALPKAPPPQFVRPLTAGPGDLTAGYGMATARAALPDRARSEADRTNASLQQANEHLKAALAATKEQLSLTKSQLRQVETLVLTVKKQLLLEEKAMAADATDGATAPPARPRRRTPR